MMTTASAFGALIDACLRCSRCLPRRTKRRQINSVATVSRFLSFPHRRYCIPSEVIQFREAAATSATGCTYVARPMSRTQFPSLLSVRATNCRGPSTPLSVRLFGHGRRSAGFLRLSAPKRFRRFEALPQARRFKSTRNGIRKSFQLSIFGAQ